MSWKSAAAIAASLAGIVTACVEFTANYSVEFHLEPNRPMLTRVWADDEAIPVEIAEAF